MSGPSLAKLERHLYAAADLVRREGMDVATYEEVQRGTIEYHVSVSTDRASPQET